MLPVKSIYFRFLSNSRFSVSKNVLKRTVRLMIIALPHKKVIKAIDSSDDLYTNGVHKKVKKTAQKQNKGSVSNLEVVKNFIRSASKSFKLTRVATVIRKEFRKNITKTTLPNRDPNV
jgi:hypothetical protein